MEQAKLALLTEKAREIRIGALTAVYSAASGHPGGSLSIADILSYLYFSEMNVDPKDPKKADRDRLVLSKGHTAPALYAALAARGYFDAELLKTFRQADSILQGHPDMKHIPGVDMTTGSLGLGFSAANGMALSAKISAIPTVSMRFSATARRRRGRFGRRRCSARIISSITLSRLWISTDCKSTAKSRRL